MERPAKRFCARLGDAPFQVDPVAFPLASVFDQVHIATMEQPAFDRCLSLLLEAETCMVDGIDHWHMARLSHVIESLKEDYLPRFGPPDSRSPSTD